MTTRSIETVVRFSTSFELAAMAGRHPAGDYRVDVDEVLIEGASRPVWRRSAGFLHIPAIGTPSLKAQMVPMTLSEVDAALREPSPSNSPLAPDL